MTPPTAIPSEVFLNVRRSYRLLHDYQQMVINAIRYVGRELDIEEWYSYSHFAGDAVQSARNLHSSAWDWLPMMSAVFHFQKTLSNDEHMSLSFLILSDTGFINGDGNEKDKEDTSTFENVRDSQTKFAFFLYGGPAHLFAKTMFSSDQLHGFLRQGTDLGPNVTGKIFDADYLCSEAKLNEVIQDILQVAQSLNLPLQLRKKFL